MRRGPYKKIENETVENPHIQVEVTRNGSDASICKVTLQNTGESTCDVYFKNTEKATVLKVKKPSRDPQITTRPKQLLKRVHTKPALGCLIFVVLILVIPKDMLFEYIEGLLNVYELTEYFV